MLPFRSPQKTRLTQLLLSALALVCGLGFWLKAYHSAMDLYCQPSELVPGIAQSVRLGGHIVPSSITHTGDTYSFLVADDSAQVRVHYSGVVPSLFQEGMEAIVLGEFDGATFWAKDLWVKHDQNYRLFSQEALCS